MSRSRYSTQAAARSAALQAFLVRPERSALEGRTVCGRWAVALLLLSCGASAPAQDAAPEPAAQNVVMPVPTSEQVGELVTLIDTNHPFYQAASGFSNLSSLSLNPLDTELFQDRFEKYLNTAEETSEDDLQYQKTVQAIVDALAPQRANSQNVSTAFRLLPRASNYRADANLCDNLANAVYSVWQTQRNQQRLSKARADLEEERKRVQWNRQMATKRKSMSRTNSIETAVRLQPFQERLTEINGLMVKNTVKREVSEIQAKIEFQSLVVQFFFQRRFQHTLMATRFYRQLFGDGDTSLQLEGSSKAFFDQGTGMPPTVGTLDSVSNEIIKDVREGVEAFTFLLEKGELASATKRLATAYALGEYLPEIRTLPREKKRRVVAFAQKAGRLQSALEARDFDLAETLAQELGALASDFDLAKPLAAIRTSKTVSNLHLAKAKNAAVSGDVEALEEQLRLATESWPLNPALTNTATTMFSLSDTQQQALVDLDRLLKERNFRRIFEDKFRFAAAVALDTNRQVRLQEVLDTMQTIEGTLARSREIAKHGDPVGAWEVTERAYQDFPEDTALNELRANLTADAANFVRAIKKAEELENAEQTGSSLAWYLQAQKLYPPSSFAREGIDRLVKQVLPEETVEVEPAEEVP